MDITALFDDVDTAEIALTNLKALGIHPSRYKIKALHITEQGERYGNAFAPAAPVNQNGANIPVNTGFFGTFTVMHGGAAFDTGEAPNREVRLLITVDDREAYRTQSALISNHARRVRLI
jgi:hypothetical protein